MCEADYWTDHRLVVSKLNLRIQLIRRQQGKKVPKRLDVSKMKQDNKKQAFFNDICRRVDALEHSSVDLDEDSLQRHRSLFSTSLGPVSRKHHDWFDENDEEIQGLLEKKHQKHNTSFSDTNSVSSKTA